MCGRLPSVEEAPTPPTTDPLRGALGTPLTPPRPQPPQQPNSQPDLRLQNPSVHAHPGEGPSPALSSPVHEDWSPATLGWASEAGPWRVLPRPVLVPELRGLPPTGPWAEHRDSAPENRLTPGRLAGGARPRATCPNSTPVSATVLRMPQAQAGDGVRVGALLVCLLQALCRGSPVPPPGPRWKRPKGFFVTSNLRGPARSQRTADRRKTHPPRSTQSSVATAPRAWARPSQAAAAHPALPAVSGRNTGVPEDGGSLSAPLRAPARRTQAQRTKPPAAWGGGAAAWRRAPNAAPQSPPCWPEAPRAWG